MKRTSYFLLTLLSFNLFSEETNKTTDEVANNELVMQRLARTPDSMNKKERVAVLDAQMNDVFTTAVRGDYGARAASARPPIDSYRIFAKADLLFWKEYIGGQDYAYTDRDIGTYVVGANKHLSFDWGWGARGELGYHFPHDSWDGLVRYTWFKTTANNRMAAPVGGSIQPLYVEYQPTLPSFVQAHWGTKLSVLDAEFGKNFFLNRWISCNPFFGLKTAWINQSMNAKVVQFPVQYQTTYVNGKSNFWGIGPWGGVSTTTHFTRWLNAFCSFGGSLMVSQSHIKTKEIQGSAASIDLKENVTQIAPTMQAALGIGWETSFNRNRNHVAVRASYEALYWWRQNQFTYYGANDTNSPPLISRYAEDLAFHGCTLDLLFDF